MTKKTNPFLLYDRNREGMAWLYRQARRYRDDLYEFYVVGLIGNRRVSKIDLTKPGLLEMAAAVAAADVIGKDWPVADLLKKSTIDLSPAARRVLADWLDRRDPRKTPEHEMTEREHQIHSAGQEVDAMIKRRVSLADAVQSVAKRKKIPAKTLANFVRGKRGSSRRP